MLVPASLWNSLYFPSRRFLEFPADLLIAPNRLDFSVKIQNMLADIEKCISKYFECLVRCIAFSGKIFLNVGIGSFWPGMWQILWSMRDHTFTLFGGQYIWIWNYLSINGNYTRNHRIRKIVEAWILFFFFSPIMYYRILWDLNKVISSIA